MLSILLTVLKILGIIILCVLALVLLLLLMVLFVPLRYKASGQFRDKKIKFNAKATYFLHIISVSVFYSDKLEYAIRIFGFKLNLKKNKDKPAKTKDKEKHNISKTDLSKEKEEISDNRKEEHSNQEVNVNELVDNVKLEKTDDEKDAEDNKDEPSGIEKKPGKKKEKKQKNEDDSEEKESFTEKLEKIRDNIDYWKEFITSESTKRAFLVCIHRIGMLLKSMLPRKGYIKARIGLEDAGITGKIAGAYWALYRYIGRVVSLSVDYEEQIIDFEFNFRGKIVPFNLLIQLILIYFDKDCNKIIHMFIDKDKK